MYETLDFPSLPVSFKSKIAKKLKKIKDLSDLVSEWKKDVLGEIHKIKQWFRRIKAQPRHHNQMYETLDFPSLPVSFKFKIAKKLKKIKDLSDLVS